MNSRVAIVLIIALVSVYASDDRTIITKRDGVPANSGWSILRASEGDRPVTFTITLQRQNLARLEEIFWDVSNPDSPNYSKYLTKGEVMDLIEAPADVQKRVMQWIYETAKELPKGDLQKVDNQRDAIEVRATARLAEKLFATQMYLFHNYKSNVVVSKHLGTLSIPSHLTGDIVMISGITELPPVKDTPIKKDASKHKRQSDDNQCNVPYTIGQLYGVPAGLAVNNSKVNVSIYANNYLGEGQGFGTANLQTFQQANDVPQTPISCIRGNALENYGAEGTDIEAELDTQTVVTWAAASTCFYLMSTENGWMYEFARFFFNQPDSPLVVSISYGFNENIQCDNASNPEFSSGLGNCTYYNIPNSQVYVNQTNMEYIKLGVIGRTVVVASGDDGSVGGHGSLDGCTSMASMFPAASPYVTSVGATSIEVSTMDSQRTSYPTSGQPPICTQAEYQCECSTSTNEQVASINNTAGFCSGGGFSVYSMQPAYQTNAVNGYFKSGAVLPSTKFWNPKNRGYPDIAAVGDNVCVFTSPGACEGVGGTSCASPIIASLITLLNNDRLNAGKTPLGFFNPVIYKMYDTAKSTYFTNTFDSSNNSGECDGVLGFNSAPGYWSPMNGCGSPKFGAIRAYVATLK
jgi:tripeptidyl-peptidase-1